MPSVTIDAGKTMSYEERGSGRPLVLLHGFPLDARIWERQLETFGDRFRVIAPDLPGFGRSASDQKFTIKSLAEDVHQLLKQIGALPCALGGLSMGGYVALAFAKLCPRDLNALILIDTRAEGDTAEGKEKRNKMIELARGQGSRAVADQMFPNMVTAAHGADPSVGGKLRTIMEACPPRTIEHALLAMRDRPDFTSDLPSIGVPTLILVGANDAITPPPMAQAMHKAISRSKLVEIPDAGHMTPMEQPDAVNRAIRDFLSAAQ